MTPDAPRFIADPELFPLCKALRLLGFDSLYRGNLSPDEALRRSIEERRIWIRKAPEDLNLQYGVRYFVVEHDDVSGQLAEIDSQCRLRDFVEPFSLCLKCNQSLKDIARQEAKIKVPERVFQSFEEFSCCPVCGRVYWPGGHYQRMQKKLESWGW